jgi:ACS family sodium-dependent inorganic phosphate cotransporter
MASITFAGVYAGTVIAMPASGLLAIAYGWESVFYVFGAIGCVWLVLWMIIVRRGPEDDPFISEEEKNYIVKKIGLRKEENVSPPWRAIFTSAPVWAIVASHCAENWGFYTLLTQLPTFLNGKFKKSKILSF